MLHKAPLFGIQKINRYDGKKLKLPVDIFFFIFDRGRKKVSFSFSVLFSLKKHTEKSVKYVAAAVDRRAPLKLISSLGLAAGAERGNISLRIKRSSSLEGTHKKRERVLKMQVFFLAPSLFLVSPVLSINIGASI